MLIAATQLRQLLQIRQFSHPLQQFTEEPGKPDALTLPVRPYQVHTVVPVPGPHQGEAVGPDRQAAADGTPAVLEECGPFKGYLRHGEGLVLIGCQYRGVEERDLCRQNRLITGGADIVGDHIGEPEQVV